MEDEKIIELFFQRSETAIEQVRKKYGGLCTAVAGRILRDVRDIEECVTDTWLRLWRSIPPGRPASLKSYIARIARNLALDRYAYNTADRRNSALTDAFEELEGELGGAAASAEVLEDEAFRELLNVFLRELNRNARIYFVRRYWYGESIKEIAESCGCSEDAVKSSLFRSRAKLRNMLEKEETAI